MFETQNSVSMTMTMTTRPDPSLTDHENQWFCNDGITSANDYQSCHRLLSRADRAVPRTPLSVVYRAVPRTEHRDFLVLVFLVCDSAIAAD